MTKVFNPYETLRAKLVDIIDESPNIKTFTLEPEIEFFFRTGEFIQLTLDGIGESPFTPSSSPYVHDKLDITIMKAGYVTEKIHQLKGGEILGIRGPFGHGYPVEKFYGKDVIILGGGCGLAPIRSLLYELIENKEKFNKATLCYGSKTPTDCIYKPMFCELDREDKFHCYRSVDVADESWEGHVGVVTTLLDKISMDLKKTVVVVCGPPVMMKFGTLKLLGMGLDPSDIYLSMEKNMSCGFGKCGHCMLGNTFVCKDGPVYAYQKIKNFEHIW